MQNQILIVLLSVTFCNNLPQYYNGGPIWRAQTRSISNDYYQNQRFSNNRPPPYYDYDTDETIPFPYVGKHDDDDDEYRAPQVFSERHGVVQRVQTSERTVIRNGDNFDNHHESRRNNQEHIIRRTATETPGPSPNANANAKKQHSTRILNHQRRKAPVASPEEMQGDDTFFFPGITNADTTEKTSGPGSATSLNTRFLPDERHIISKCSKGSTYCTNVENYPAAYIADVLRNSAVTYNDLLGEDELVRNVSVVPRINLLETPMCESKEILEHPKMAQNKDNKWLFIINQDDYVQGIRVEICEKESSACALSKSFPYGYVTECKQKYIYRKMLALTGDGQPGPDSFRLPSCCSCVYKTGGVSMRAGIPKSSDGSPSKRRK